MSNDTFVHSCAIACKTRAKNNEEDEVVIPGDNRAEKEAKIRLLGLIMSSASYSLGKSSLCLT